MANLCSIQRAAVVLTQLARSHGRHSAFLAETSGLWLEVARPDNETAESRSQSRSFGGIAVSQLSFQKGASAISVPHPSPILVDL
jgi:hypothetical protein